MKSLAVITKRSMILSLCILIECCFCFTPVTASAYDGAGDAEQKTEIAQVASIGGSSESLRMEERMQNKTEKEGKIAKALEDPGEQVEYLGTFTDFAFENAQYSDIRFTSKLSVPEDISIKDVYLYYIRDDKADYEYSCYNEKEDIWASSCEIVDLVNTVDLKPLTNKSFDVDYFMVAEDDTGNIVAKSDIITLGIDISNIRVGDPYFLNNLPSTIDIANIRWIPKDIDSDYSFDYYVEGKNGTASKSIPTGTVTSVTSGSPKVINISESDLAFALEPLKTGSSKITIKYEVNGVTKTKTKTIKVFDQYLDFRFSQQGRIRYEEIPAGTSAKFDFTSGLFKYNYTKKQYEFKGIVTDNATFKIVDYYASGPNGDFKTDKVTASISGNVLTIKATKTAPLGKYTFKVKGTFGDATVDGYVYTNVYPEVERLLINDDFYLPLKGATSKFNPTFVHYSKGTKTTQKVKKWVVNFDGLTVKDKSGTTIKTRSELKPSQLPLTLKGKNNKADFYAKAYVDDSKYAYIEFKNQNLLNALTIKLSSSSKTYTGNALKPTVTLDYHGTTVSKDGYKISYINNKNVGTATIKIADKESDYNYRYVTFKINPKKPTIKTPAALTKGLTAKWAAMKTKMSTERITGYQVQIATNKGFTKNKKSVKVAGYSKVSKKFTGLKAKTTYYVRVRTYKKIGRTTYYSPWSAVKSVKTK